MKRNYAMKEKWSCGNFSWTFFHSSIKSRFEGIGDELQRGSKKDKRKKSLTRSQFPEPGGSTSKTRLQNHPVIPLKPLSNVFRVTQLFRPHRPATLLLTKSIDLSTDRIIGWVVIVKEYRKRFGALDSFAPTFLTFDNNDQPICKKPYDEKSARDERVYRVNLAHSEWTLCVSHSIECEPCDWACISLLDIYRIRLSQKYRVFFFFFFGTIKSATLERRCDNFIHRKVKKKKKKEGANKINEYGGK